MTESSESTSAWIISQAERFTSRVLSRPRVFDDTTHYMSIDRDDVIYLEGKHFLVTGNAREGRFTIDDQPKFWVKRALDLDTGKAHMLKLVFHEEFKVRIGPLDIRCSRSPRKEGLVLELLRGDPRVMQGRTVKDTKGNVVRVIDTIHGPDLLSYLSQINMPHEKYFQERFPDVLAKTIECFGAIQALHDARLCHGDIRNDHIFVEEDTGRYRWIDFDLTQDFRDFDVWSMGNIVHCIVAKGFVTFREALKAQPELSERLSRDDASLFFPHRIMNLGAVFPYVPSKLNDVLMRFSVGTEEYYDSIEQVLSDLVDCAASMGWPVEASKSDGVTT